MSEVSRIPRNSFKVLLSIFSGEEKEYVRRSDRKARIILAIIGGFVILIFLGCLISAHFFFSSLMENNYAVSIPVGIFWGMLVVNMYLLLLYTVSPSILPHKKNKEGTDNGLFTLSMFLRVVFMALLAVITAQPLNVELFSSSVSQSLYRHTQQEKAKMIISTDSYIVAEEVRAFMEFSEQLKLTLNSYEYENFKTQIRDIEKKINSDDLFVKQAGAVLKRLVLAEKKMFLSKKELDQQTLDLTTLNQMIDTEIHSDRQLLIQLQSLDIQHKDYLTFKTQLLSAVTSKLKNYDDLNKLLLKTNFYIKRIQLIFYENPWSWLATSFICFLFILPIILKYRVRKVTDYYSKRIKLEKQDVVNRYELFKEDYCELLRKNIQKYNFSSQIRLGIELEKLKMVSKKRYRKLKEEMQAEYREEVFLKYEYWSDNPFRTNPKKKINIPAQTPVSLMDFLYNSDQNDSKS